MMHNFLMSAYIYILMISKVSQSGKGTKYRLQISHVPPYRGSHNLFLNKSVYVLHIHYYL